jgi:uncharacterized membrane protein YeaQ/YmgE (transglycosylase-associated protein family)
MSLDHRYRYHLGFIIRRNYMFIAGLGAIFFGCAIGWIAYRILRQRASTAALSDFFTILGVIGGAAVIALFKSDVLFGLYSIGLVVGFFAYLGVGMMLYGEQELLPWRIEQIPPTPTPGPPANATPTPDPPANVTLPDVRNADVGNTRGSASQSSRRSKTSNANPTDVENAG